MALSTVLVFGLRSQAARADDLADEADVQFALAAARYEAGDYMGALEHFLTSNRLVPNRNVLFNIARTYEQLKRAPDAYRYYVQALAGETDPAVSKRVEDAIARITPQVAILKVETNPPGATVYLDRKDLGPRGTSPLTLGLPAGSHKVIVELAGHEPAATEKDVAVKLGRETKVSLKLVPILGNLEVQGTDGAEVRIDHETGPVLCTVPCRAPVPPGRHLVFVTKPGFVGSESTIDVPPNGSAVVRARMAVQTGSLIVSTDVRNAVINLDGSVVGFTPAVLNVPVGPHVVSVSHSGFRTIERKVVVSATAQTKLDLELAAVEEVVAASRVTESVEDAPASVTIISKQELMAMAYPTIAEAVRGIRGLYLSDDTSYSTIGFRGFSTPGSYGNRTLVLLDGQPMNDNYIWSSYVGFDGRVDIDDIDRIEVIRGPGSVLYGTSAFFGVINLVTRSRNEPTHGEVSVNTALDAARTRVTGYVRLGDDAGFWASAVGARGFGRDHYFPEYVSDPRSPDAELDARGVPTDGVARDVDTFLGGMINGRVWYKALTAQWFFNVRDKVLPSAVYGSIFNAKRNTYLDKRGMVEVRFEPQVTKWLQLLSRAHGNLYDFDAHGDYPAPDYVTHDFYRGRWAGAEQRFVITPNERVRATIGGEIVQHFRTIQRGGGGTGPYLFDDRGNPGRNDPFTQAAVYTNADVTPLQRLKVSAGARFDYFSNLEKTDFTSQINPRLAVIARPYNRGVLKLMGGKAFRSPSVYELYFTNVTQARATGLKPEQVLSGEAEFTHRFSNSNVSATAAAYVNYVSDLIELGRTADGLLDQYRNSAADVRVLGAEAEMRREWRSGWMLSASYSLSHASYIDAPTLRSVTNSPLHLASVKGAVPIIGRTLMAMTRVSFEGPRPDRNVNDTDPPQGMTKAGLVWDLVFSGEAEKLGVRYWLGAYNIANWRYDIVPSTEYRQQRFVQSGRTILAGLSLTF